jgi:iron complex outermembrane recepter protein
MADGQNHVIASQSIYAAAHSAAVETRMTSLLHRFFRRAMASAVIALSFGPTGASAADAVPPQASPLPAVVVTATRTAQLPFDIPAAVNVVAMPPDGTLNVNASELLVGIPGVLARDRQNYAQDEQISIRGFGARSTFGIRGIRLYTDGIPASMPDGQGQVSHFNLDSAERVEVLRGPFSALYGNASGGVIQLFTADGTDPPQFRFGLAGGSNGVLRSDLNARGVQGPVDENIDYTHFQTDGYRDHSAARRESGNAKIGWQIDDHRRLTLVVNSLDAPNAQDPLGLTRAQYQANPRQVASAADTYNTRKSASQDQAGLIYDDQLDENNSLRLMSYYGQRSVLQYLSIPKATQLSQPGNSGGVVDLGSDYGGGDARWTWHGDLANRPFELAAGLSYDSQNQHRQGFNNFIGDTLGVTGALRRDEIDRVDDLDQYAQATWRPGDDWTLMGGVRHSSVSFDSTDHFITAANPNDSGRVDYGATTPVAGVLYRVSPTVHLYANYGKAFETPTFSELGYRSDGGSGLALNLLPVRTHSAEAGIKLQPNETTDAAFAVFRADSRDELAIATNLGGRTTYQNVDRSRRQGLEASLNTALSPHWKLQATYTYLQAIFRSPFLTCVTTPCAKPDMPVPAGTDIAGVPRSNFYAALRWGAARGWQAAVDTTTTSSVPVNDLASERAPGYTLFGLSGGYIVQSGHWRMNTFARIDNLFDRQYVGSVIVNDGNGRYYEPGPSRTFLLGVDLRWQP